MLYSNVTVAVIHTTPVTISSLKPHFEEQLPGTRVVNFLDDTILPEINECGEITPSVRYRFHSMVVNAAITKPDVILCACSSVGGLLEESRSFITVPALRIDEPMIRKAVSEGGKLGVMATLQSTLSPTVDCIKRSAEKIFKEVVVEERLLKEAGALLSAGKTDEYLSLVAAQISGLLQHNELVILAQASMAGALSLLDDELCARVLTSPQSGIAAIRELLSL